MKIRILYFSSLLCDKYSLKPCCLFKVTCSPLFLGLISLTFQTARVFKGFVPDTALNLMIFLANR